MKYLSYTEVLQSLPTLKFPLSELEVVQTTHELAARFPKFSQHEIAHFLNLHQATEQRVLADWIEADKLLSKSLMQETLLGIWKDELLVSKHQLFGNYCAVVTPFLYPVLQKEIGQINSVRAARIMSFSKLLTPENQERVQDVLGEWYVDHVKSTIDRCQSLSKDDLIYQHLLSLFTDDFFLGVNTMNERHYGVKMQILEMLTTLMYHKKSSVRLVIFIVNQLSKLELKKEHVEQLRAIETKVRKGEIVVEKTKLPWLRLGISIALLLLVLGTVTAVFFIDAKPEEEQVQEATSFMQFSKEERQKLDSLIGDVQRESRQFEGDQQLDSHVPFVGQQLTKKREWNNETIKRLYAAWSKNDSTIVTNFFSKSTPYSKPYVSTSLFGKSAGSHGGELHNNSLQTVLILVFEDRKKAPVFSKYVHAKSTATWKFTEGDYVLVVPGCVVTRFQKFGDIPFKEVNQEFYAHLNNAYQLKYNSPKKVKLVWETLGANSYLVDLSNAMDKL